MPVIKHASIIAVAASLAASPAALLAQEQAGTTDETATEESMSENMASGETPSQDAPAAPEATAEGASTDEAEEEMVEEVEGTIVLQDEDTVLANDLIGATVYNKADEAVGDINDMIINLSGAVDGVVIGVGGFLGIGEKDVALSLESIEVRMDEFGNPRLYVDANKTSLEAAAAFMTVQQQEAMEAQQQAAEQLNQGVQPAAPAEGESATTPQ